LPPPTPSEAAFERLVETFGRAPQPAAASAAPPAEASAFLDELYAKRDSYLDRESYASIGDSTGFNTKVVGVTFEGRQDVIGGLEPGLALELERQPDNPFDANAIAVRYGRLQLGFIKKAIAARIAPNIDAGARYRAEVKHITGGGTKTAGVNIWVTREASSAARRLTGERARGADVQHALLGERPLRDAQRAVLERIASGRNTLAVLGTGRGKSLCFQWPTISTRRCYAASSRSACACCAPTARSTRANAPTSWPRSKAASGTSSARRPSSCTFTSTASRTSAAGRRCWSSTKPITSSRARTGPRTRASPTSCASWVPRKCSR
jgi:hypothetical protein